MKRKIKWVIGLATLLAMLSGQAPAQKDTSYSEVFETYANRFDTLIVYHVNMTVGLSWKYRIVGVKNGQWYAIDQLRKKGLTGCDSSSKKVCHHCADSYIEVINMLTALPDESETYLPCRKIRDTIINGRQAAEINDFNTEQDVESHIFEYKFGTSKRSVSYRSPAQALKVCPESVERRQVLEIIMWMKELDKL